MTFPCASSSLAGTLDTASGSSGLLIVTGGSEIRSGAYSGQAQLAARLAEAGFPVFRFDRRGVGDSDGEDRGFRASQNDIAAALAAFQAMAPKVDRVIGFGNCDAASALMLGGGTGCDGLVLSNPWVIEDGDAAAAPPPAAIRARYAERLRNPKEVARLLSGGVNLRKLSLGLLGAMKPKPAATSLAQGMAAGLASFEGPVRILLAARDRTAQVFEAAWDAGDDRIARCENAGHSYAEPHAKEWLYQQLLASLKA
ncbi:hydrolase 1, exosortase A system-associated [Allopontixanthobacter sp.]|uniref:hydrolase 1, exosortase A system-associated n=1 Tax=Allopontixanthobacter sp. TaxID=2906452 RepID=UPI002AB89BD8|nr:hydrolase 1, exosortase A system-associated [Allopontixanthobacter sp.]MDZ4308069.1 hydrolase 1, exosortase A system-associated [Allopontixanthobacter sp.]